MSHPFGELLKQYRRRKPGLSQERLAHRIGYDEAVLVRMSQGKKDLTGPSGRDRVIRLIEALHDEGTLHTQAEANALLAAAALPPLYTGIPLERRLLQNLRPDASVISLPGIQPSPLRYTLPTPASSFVGREHEIAEVVQRFKSVRLLTLTGTGGSGKTRLALAAATELADAFPNGVCFIELAMVRQTRDILPAIALALNMREVPDITLLDSVKHFLSSKSLLLLVDNFEHVVECAPVITELLMAAPNLKVMATSREPLRLTGECIHSVEPLPLDYAVELFVQRTQAVKARFRITADLEPIVANICRRMDCLPLALELAAARMRQFSPAQLLTNLNQQRSLTLLIDAPRDAPTRHRTLRDAIGWSYKLLSANEKHVLCALSVFIGGSELELITQFIKNIASLSLAQQEIATHLQSLVDKSLVQAVEQPDSGTRYSLLELIREFAQTELATQDEFQYAQRCHADLFASLVEQSVWPIRGQGQAYWVDRLEREYANVRKSLEWSFSQGGDKIIGCRLVGALGYFWFATTYALDALHWVYAARSTDLDGLMSKTRAEVMICAVLHDSSLTRTESIDLARQALSLYILVNDLHGVALTKQIIGTLLITLDFHNVEAQHLLQEAISLAKAIGNEYVANYAWAFLVVRTRAFDDLGYVETLYRDLIERLRRAGNLVDIAGGLCHMTSVLMARLNFTEALSYAKEAVGLARHIRDPAEEVWATQYIAEITRYWGEAPRAIMMLEACLQIVSEQLRPFYAIGPLTCLGKAANEAGDYGRAKRHIKEAIRIKESIHFPSQNFGSMTYQHIGNMLDALVAVAVNIEDATHAAQLRGAADTAWANNPMPRQANNEWEFLPYIAKARATLGDEAYEAAYAEGCAMTPDQALDLALSI